jgi:uncharacterized membrane protein YfhO
MLAFDIDAGEHEIEMKYVPLQWYAGITVTLLGIVAFLSLCLIDVRKKNSYLIKTDKKENL